MRCGNRQLSRSRKCLAGNGSRLGAGLPARVIDEPAQPARADRRIHLADDFLRGEVPAPLRRLIREGQADVIRALAARAVDAQP